MKQFVVLLGTLLCGAAATRAQELPPRTIVYQGVVMTSAGLQPLAGASVLNRSAGTQTAADDAGRFRLRVQPGDTLLVTFIGYEPRSVILPAALRDDAAAVFLLVEKPSVLPSVTVRRGISEEDFERDFTKKKVPVTPPMKFWDSSNYTRVMGSVSGGAGEAAALRNRTQAEAVASAGQVRTVTLFNLFWLKKKKKKKRELTSHF